ncbi:MAG: MBL fold metallo-hydrolase [Desulfocucumaceae bacterium]
MINVSEYKEVKVFQGKVSIFGLGQLKTFAFCWDGNLVDTGPASLEKGFIAAFYSCRIERVLLTHFHEDHSGNAARLQRDKKIPVYVSPASVGELQKNAKIPLYRRLIWGKRPRLDPLSLEWPVESENGQLDVIATPGHSNDHLCLINRERGFVFTGDLFVTPHTRIIMRYESIPEIIRSLHRLLQEDFDTLYCAHAGIVERGREMVIKKLDYLEQLRGEVLDLHHKGFSIKEIDRKIFGKTQSLTYLSSGEWSSGHIISSIISHR